MGGGQAARHVAEKAADLGVNAARTIGRVDTRDIFLAGLLGDPQAGAQGRRQGGQCRRQNVGEHTGALTAAGDQQVDRPVAGRRAIGAIAQSGDLVAHRVADGPRFGLVAGGHAGGFGERGGDGGGVTRQQSIGPAQHRVLFVQDDRQTEPAGGHNRRHAGEPAEADHRRRRQSGEQDAGLKHAEGEGAAAGQSAQPAAAGAFGGDTVNRQIMAGDFERLAARVGDQHRPRTACQQSAGQSLGRKQMAAGAAGGEGDNRPVHAPSPSWTRRRVKASAMPIARASAISEEPP